MTFSFLSWDGSKAFLGTVHTCPDILESTTFFSGFKNFHVHTHPYANRICLFTRIRIHSSTRDSSGNIGNRACVVKRAKFVTCSAFVGTISIPVRHAEKSSGEEIVVAKELGSSLLRHQTKNIRIERPHDFGFKNIRIRVGGALMTERVSHIPVGAFPSML